MENHLNTDKVAGGLQFWVIILFNLFFNIIFAT